MFILAFHFGISPSPPMPVSVCLCLSMFISHLTACLGLSCNMYISGGIISLYCPSHLAVSLTLFSNMYISSCTIRFYCLLCNSSKWCHFFITMSLSLFSKLEEVEAGHLLFIYSYSLTMVYSIYIEWALFRVSKTSVCLYCTAVMISEPRV